VLEWALRKRRTGLARNAGAGELAICLRPIRVLGHRIVHGIFHEETTLLSVHLLVRPMLKNFATAMLLGCLCVPSGWAQTQSASSSPPSTAGPPSTVASPPTVGDSSEGSSRPVIYGPEKGSNEWQGWAGWAFPIPLFVGFPRAHITTAGVRYGRVLTNRHGPGLLQGRLEVAFDAVPLDEISLPGRRVYGGGFNPFAWKWDFVTRRRMSPYFELSGGGLWTNHQPLSGTTTFNFTPSAAIGVNLPWGASGKYSWTVDFRYFHISNAGLSNYNPGLNTLELRAGFGLFTHRK